MTTKVMRERLIAYLSDADDKIIRSLFALLEDRIEVQSSQLLTKEQIDFLDRERNLHMHGKSESYGWEETKQFIRANKKAS